MDRDMTIQLCNQKILQKKMTVTNFFLNFFCQIWRIYLTEVYHFFIFFSKNMILNKIIVIIYKIYMPK